MGQQDGIQRVLRQQAEILALQQRPQTLQPFQQSQPFQQPQPQTFQQPQPVQQTQPQPLQNTNLPQVPGLQQHQAQLTKHLAVELQHNVNQPQQISQSQQFSQPQQISQPPNQVPGLEQHARFVSELQAAQNALG